MRYEGLRARLKQARRERSLSQSALAARSGTSRVTIARLEGGGELDIRLGTVESVCRALGLELAALPRGGEQALQARLARERARAAGLERRLAHARLAARLLAERPDRARALVKRARAMVGRWEREGLCSDHYVSRWRAKLRGRAERVARALVEPDAWDDALFQNTPWSFALDLRRP